jgi:hypothetical protein
MGTQSSTSQCGSASYPNTNSAHHRRHASLVPVARQASGQDSGHQQVECGETSRMWGKQYSGWRPESAHGFLTHDTGCSADRGRRILLRSGTRWIHRVGSLADASPRRSGRSGPARRPGRFGRLLLPTLASLREIYPRVTLEGRLATVLRTPLPAQPCGQGAGADGPSAERMHDSSSCSLNGFER